MPHGTGHWDSMREYEDRIQELREQAAEDGIELNEESVSNAMEFLSAITPAQAETGRSSRLLDHGSGGTDPAAESEEDEWRIPPLDEL